MQLDKSLLAVIVIGVDDGKRLLQNALAGQNRLPGAPGLGAALRQADALRQRVQRLIGVGDLHTQLGAGLFDAVADGLTERVLDVLADDEHDLVEPGLDGIMDGKIHDDLAVGADSGQLFDTAAEPGTDAGSHDDQSSFHKHPPKNDDRRFRLRKSMVTGTNAAWR